MYLMIHKQCIYFKMVIEIIRDFYRIYFYRQSWQDSCKLWGSSSLKENNEFKLKCCISISHTYICLVKCQTQNTIRIFNIYTLRIKSSMSKEHKNWWFYVCWIWDLEVSKLNLWKYSSVRKTGSSSCLFTKREDGGEDNNVNKQLKVLFK